MIIKIPDFLRQLREPWLEGVPKELQRHIRFNAEIGERNGVYKVCDYMSGGQNTIIDKAVSEEEYRTLSRLIEQEYFPREFDHQAQLDFESFLNEKCVALSVQLHSKIATKEFPDIVKRVVPQEVFQMTKDLYELLPRHHLGHEHFKELRLGGWGHGAAKCSGYEDPVVHMFKFAVGGARRNYAGLLLHETGHAHFKSLDEKTKEDIRGCFFDIGRNSGKWFEPFAVDYLLGRDSRTDEVKDTLNEFAAETYLLYIVKGAGLKDETAVLPDYVRMSWQKLYNTFKKSFRDIEYE